MPTGIALIALNLQWNLLFRPFGVVGVLFKDAPVAAKAASCPTI
jgi:hypothetical protein